MLRFFRPQPFSMRNCQPRHPASLKGRQGALHVAFPTPDYCDRNHRLYSPVGRCAVLATNKTPRRTFRLGEEAGALPRRDREGANKARHGDDPGRPTQRAAQPAHARRDDLGQRRQPRAPRRRRAAGLHAADLHRSNDRPARARLVVAALACGDVDFGFKLRSVFRDR